MSNNIKDSIKDNSPLGIKDNNKLAERINDEIVVKGGLRKEETKRGGRRPGAGRPRGSKNPLTRKAEKQEKTVKERVLKNIPDLLNAQLNLAKGVQYLFKIEMRHQGDRKKPVHVLVTDPLEVQKYLDGDTEDEYYYITTEKPDNKAIDSLLDRAFGKAGQTNTTDNNFNVNIINYEEKQKLPENVHEAEVIEADVRDISGDTDETDNSTV